MSQRSNTVRRGYAEIRMSIVNEIDSASVDPIVQSSIVANQFQPSPVSANREPTSVNLSFSKNQIEFFEY